MIDVSKGRVRVSPSRLITLKANISDLDREIQKTQQDISYFLTMGASCWGLFDMTPAKFRALVEKRSKMDERRKSLRLKIRGISDR
jgi:hypothetical protein